MWHGIDTKSSICPNLTTSQATYYPDEYQSIDYSLIDTSFSPPLSLSEGCLGKYYCGTDVYLLKDGTLLLPSDELSIKFLRNLTKKFIPCREDHPLKEVTAYDLAINTDLKTLIDFHILQCERVKSSIHVNREIQNSDLIYLSPVYPGKSFAHLLTSTHSLKQFSVILERIYNISVNCSIKMSCHITFMKPGYSGIFTLKDHCFEPLPSLRLLGVICMWVNGIGFGINKLYYPHSYFTDLIEEDYIKASNSGIIYHPPSSETDNDTTISGDTETPDSTTTQTGFWDKLEHVLYLIMTIVSILIVGCTTIYCFKMITPLCTNSTHAIKAPDHGSSTHVDRNLLELHFLPSTDKSSHVSELHNKSSDLSICTSKSDNINNLINDHFN